MTMNILDIDLDFFLDEIIHNRTGEERVANEEATPWFVEDVEKYLTSNCGLDKNNKVKGTVVEKHHELFDVWKDLIHAGKITTRFKLVHVDAHADINDTMFGEKVTHGTIFRRAIEERLVDPNKMTQIGLRTTGYSAEDFD